MGTLGTLLAATPRRLAALAAGLAAVVAGALMTAGGGAQPAAATTPALAPAPAGTVLVFVSGAVTHPGLYSLASGARTADAIAAAGGMLASADPGRLPDLAGLVHDGHQVNVPFAKGSAAATTVRVDANSASTAELESIPGVTADIAQAIVSIRESWGLFANLSDLRAALGLDTATAALIGKHLRFLTTVG